MHQRPSQVMNRKPCPEPIAELICVTKHPLCRQRQCLLSLAMATPSQLCLPGSLEVLHPLQTPRGSRPGRRLPHLQHPPQDTPLLQSAPPSCPHRGTGANSSPGCGGDALTPRARVEGRPTEGGLPLQLPHVPSWRRRPASACTPLPAHCHINPDFCICAEVRLRVQLLPWR